MLIKSQSSKTIVNTNTLTCLYVDENKIYCCTTHNYDECGYLMGTYKTDNEARAALDKLYKAIDEPKYDMGKEKTLPETARIDFASGEFPF